MGDYSAIRRCIRGDGGSRVAMGVVAWLRGIVQYSHLSQSSEGSSNHSIDKHSRTYGSIQATWPAKASHSIFLSKALAKARLRRTTANSLPAVHSLTDVCWTKCITGAIKSKSLDKNEESCTKNCVDRFLDSQFLVIKQLEGLRGGQ